MPWKPANPCRDPGCPEDAGRSGYCADHIAERRREQDRRRSGAPHRRVYHLTAWARLRRRKLLRDPVCQCRGDCCPPHGCHQRATTVDHVVPVLFGGPALPDLDGLLSLTKSCHDRKTGRESLPRPS